jgi:hypothetical protein
MSNRVLRAGFLALPFVSMSFGLIAACSDDENPASGRDAAADVAVLLDGSSTFDGSTILDAGRDARDSSITDTGADAPDVFDAGPPLCAAYPDTVLPGDSGAGGEPDDFTRYRLIALRAIYTGAFTNLLSASATCEINNYFGSGDPPFQEDCLGAQLAALAGCSVAALPVNYDTAQDIDGNRCVPDGGVGGVQLGFQNVGTTPYTQPDVDLMIRIIVESALSTGMAQVDADRLKAILEAKRAAVLIVDAGGVDAGDGGFSANLCP